MDDLADAKFRSAKFSDNCLSRKNGNLTGLKPPLPDMADMRQDDPCIM